MKVFFILLIFMNIFFSNAFFTEECFPKVRRVCENKRKKYKHGKIYIVDIDGTICDTKQSDYYNSIPKLDNIKSFNELYDQGNELHYWTARGSNSGINWDEYTVKQLNDWGVKYTSINLGKPHYDIWIDDKALNVDDICNHYDGN